MPAAVHDLDAIPRVNVRHECINLGLNWHLGVEQDYFFPQPMRRAKVTRLPFSIHPITMKNKPFLFIHLGTLVLSTGLTMAQERAGKAEAGGRLAEFIKRADTNQDGKISKEEFDGFSKRENADRFAKMDANADGSVDSIEIEQAADKVRDGMRRVAGEEGRPGGLRRPAGEGGEGGFRRPPGDKPEGSPRPEGDRPMPPAGSAGPAINPKEIFGRMDKNADGSVDKEEYLEFSKQELEGRFARMDQNTDGKVTEEELRSGIERMRSMMRGGPGGPPGGTGGFRRPGEGTGEGGFRRPPQQEGGGDRPRPELENDTPKKDPI